MSGSWFRGGRRAAGGHRLTTRPASVEGQPQTPMAAVVPRHTAGGVGLSMAAEMAAVRSRWGGAGREGWGGGQRAGDEQEPGCCP